MNNANHIIKKTTKENSPAEIQEILAGLLLFYFSLHIKKDAGRQTESVLCQDNVGNT